MLTYLRVCCQKKKKVGLTSLQLFSYKILNDIFQPICRVKYFEFNLKNKFLFVVKYTMLKMFRIFRDKL